MNFELVTHDTRRNAVVHKNPPNGEQREHPDLRAIQRELNCAAMQAPSDPELMEALSALPETEAIQILCKALDQMRHFLWFYTQVMSNEPELGDKLRQSNPAKPVEESKVDTSFLDQLTRADEAALLRYLVDAKERKPN